MKKALTFGMLGELLVVVHGEPPPTDAEWLEYIDAWEGYHTRIGRSRVLVWTEGGAPTAAQRHRLDERVRRFGPDTARTAVLGDSLFARVVTNAMSAMEHARASRFWGGGHGPESSRVYRMFARSDLRQALAWLDVSPTREPEIVRYIEQLVATLASG